MATSKININGIGAATLLASNTTVAQNDADALKTVPDLKQFRAVILATLNGDDLLSPIIIPMNIFKGGQRWFSSYAPGTNAYNSWTRYKDDTTVCLAKWTSGSTAAYLYGIK